jgi:DNA-binding protein H-NS
MATDLSKMNEKQLEKLKTDIEKELKGRQSQKISEARKAVEDAAKKHGFSLNDLIGAKSRKSPSVAKFRNPADKSQTWTGRGRQPDWFKTALAAGKTPDDMKA